MARKIEFVAKCNDGTRFRIYYNADWQAYALEYRNDLKGVSNPYDNFLTKGKWVNLHAENSYSGILSFMFDEIREINAINGD